MNLFNDVFGALIALIGLLAAAFAWSSAADAATLRSHAAVEGHMVTLGDIFEGAGEAAAVEVAPAPLAGEADTISVSHIARIARRAGVRWENSARLSRVTVTKQGEALPVDLIESAIAQALEAQELQEPGSIDVRLAPGMAALHVAPGAPATLKVEHISRDPRSSRFDAIVRAPAGDPSAPRKRLTGTAVAVAEVPVVTSAVSPGEPIRASQVSWARVPKHKANRNVITDADQLIGRTPKRPLRLNEPVRLSDVTEPVAVEKDTLVMLSYAVPGMVLTARARALQDGAVGDAIDVLNPRSNRKIQAVVTGAGTARIDAFDFSGGIAGPLALNR